MPLYYEQSCSKQASHYLRICLPHPYSRSRPADHGPDRRHLATNRRSGYWCVLPLTYAACLVRILCPLTNRLLLHSAPGLLCDLLWSDPEKEVDQWGENDRGVSFTFGPSIVEKFLQQHDLDLICRAHQVVEDGYEFFAQRQLVTVFSAPNYCGTCNNKCAPASHSSSPPTYAIPLLPPDIPSIVPRRIRQCGSHDDGGQGFDVLLPDFEACRQKVEIPLRGQRRRCEPVEAQLRCPHRP